MSKIAVFDFDSTIMDGETIDILAKEAGVEMEVSKITREAMEGRVDFFESLIKRVALLKGMQCSKVDEICANLPYIEGAKEIIEYLKRLNYKVFLFSGGFSNATSIARDRLGFDMDFSNTLHTKSGILTGLVGGEMTFSNSKGVMLKKLQTILGVKKENTVVVGDGANDLSMFRESGVKIAFCAKEVLKKEADFCIDEKDLRLIANYVRG